MTSLLTESYLFLKSYLNLKLLCVLPFTRGKSLPDHAISRPHSLYPLWYLHLGQSKHEMLLDHRTKMFHIHSYTLHKPQEMKESILPVELLVVDKETSIHENIATSKQVEKHKTTLPPCFFPKLSYHPGQDLYPFPLVFWMLLSASDTKQFPALLNSLKEILSRESVVTTPRTTSFTSGMYSQQRFMPSIWDCPAAGISKPAGHAGCQIKTW